MSGERIQKAVLDELKWDARVKRTDEKIARAARNALEWLVDVPPHSEGGGGGWGGGGQAWFAPGVREVIDEIRIAP